MQQEASDELVGVKCHSLEVLAGDLCDLADHRCTRHWIGPSLGCSLEETAICVVDEAGGIVREARVASEPDALVSFFDALGMTMERVGLEACSLTAWLHQELSGSGIPAVCIEARQAESRDGCDAEQDRPQRWSQAGQSLALR